MIVLARHVLLTELRRLVRDRRAIVSAIVLPALLYPVLLWGSQRLEEVSQETQREQEVQVAVDLTRASEADAALAGELRAAIDAAEPIVVSEVDAGPVIDLLGIDPPAEVLARKTKEVAGDEIDVLVCATVHPEVPDRVLVRVLHDVQSDASREARGRVFGALRKLERTFATARRDALLGGDPASSLLVSTTDLASEEDRGGDLLGRLLPLIVVLILVSGGAYAALAVFAGEREEGTLETLLVQPVPVRAVTYGKAGAVLLAGIVTVLVNLASLAACAAAGLTAGIGGDGAGVGPTRALAAVVYLPGCALICAVLCLVCGRARSFRAGQHALLPVTLVAALPTALVLKPDLVHTPLLACVPLSGAALSLRDALRGDLTFGTTLAMVVSHAIWSALVLARLSYELSPERSLHGADAHRERPDARRAITWGGVSLIAMYLIGARMQAHDPVRGLVATLAGLVPLLALGAAWTSARARGEGWLGQTYLRLPSPFALLGALLLTPALTHAVRWMVDFQMEVLPYPGGLDDSAIVALLEDLGPVGAVVVIALLPAVFEELLFRGTLLRGLRRDLPPLVASAWAAGFFAVMHLSLHRLVPTFTIGVVAGLICLRARSVWPAVLLHLVHNATVLYWDPEVEPILGATLWDWYKHPAWAFGLVPLGLLCLRRGGAPASRAREGLQAV